jgi:hypothetical protein
MVHRSARAQHNATTAQVNFHLTAVAVIIFVLAATSLQMWQVPTGANGWLGLGGAGVGLTLGRFVFLPHFASFAPFAQRCRAIWSRR